MNTEQQLLQDDIHNSVKAALAEDVGAGDLTALLIPENQVSHAAIITRENCVFCGQSWLEEVFKQLGGVSEINWLVAEGQELQADTRIVELIGNTRKLLTGERTALNYLQLLSGTATISRTYAQRAEGTPLRLFDTRKTIPGLRTAQKYAVRIGGCSNHRMALYDAFLIKENHIATCGGITQAINSAKALKTDRDIIIEVETLTEYKEAVLAKPDVIMLDNFSEGQLIEALEDTSHNIALEVTGNIEIESLGKLSKTKEIRVSSGALTKHVKAIDLSFRLEK